MSQTLDCIKEDVKTAMKARETDKLTTLRMIHASIKNQAIELQRELTDEDITEVLAREVKKRRQSARAFDEGDRPEMAARERAEIQWIEVYLPEQLTDEAVHQIVSQVIEDTSAQSRRDMGKVMGAVIPKIKGRYDASKIKDIVLEKLS